jgi:hypothetical protein
MTQPVVSRRTWQLADLSRTVDETVLAIEYERLNLEVARPAEERHQLQADAAVIISAILRLLERGSSEEKAQLGTSREVIVPSDIAENLLRRVEDETALKRDLAELARILPTADSIDNDLLELLDKVAQVADAAATTSLRPLMRK